MSATVTPNGLSCARVREVLSYCPDTGILRWKVSRCGRVKAGDTAGTPDKDGYLLVTVDGKKRKSHRLAWAIHHGVWPEGQIDHINLVKTDNRLENLRDTTAAVNMQNVAKPNKRNKCGVLGVVRQGDRFKSTLTVGGRTLHIGTFSSAEAAHEGYLSAKRDLHPGCTI